MQALNEVRTLASQSNERGYLSHKAIQEQVQASLESSGVTATASIYHLYINHNPTSGFDSFDGNP